MSGLGRYSKLIVALLGVAVTVLEQTQGWSHWAPVLTSASAALGVYLVPNSPAPVKAPKP